MNDPMSQLALRFTQLRLLTETRYGQVYAGEDFTGGAVTVAVLSEAAAADPALREAFSDRVWRHSPGAVPDHATVYAADLQAARPWAAIRNPAGQPGAEQLLAGLDEAGAPPDSPTSGSGASGPVASPAFPQPAAPAFPPATAPAFPPPGAAPTPAPGHSSGPPPPTPGVGVPSAGGPTAGYPASGQDGRLGSGWPWLIGVAAAVVVLAVAAVATVVGVRLYQEAKEGASDPTPAPPAHPSPAPGSTDDDPAPDPSPEPGEPELRDVEQISLIGPVWEDGENTYTMSFPGWPFAFRTPRTWGCMRGSYELIPDAPAWSCIDESNPDSRQRVNVLLWECPTTCTAGEREDMIEVWLDHPEEAARPDDLPVVYVEYEENARGNYAIDLSFFGGAGGDIRWHVGVYLESPPETRDVVLKILNDILSQSA